MICHTLVTVLLLQLLEGMSSLMPANPMFPQRLCSPHPHKAGVAVVTNTLSVTPLTGFSKRTQSVRCAPLEEWATYLHPVVALKGIFKRSAPFSKPPVLSKKF